MSKLERDSVRIITFGITESPQGVLRVTSLNVQGQDRDTNQAVNITSLTPDEEQVLADEVAKLIKRIVQFQYMDANN